MVALDQIVASSGAAVLGAILGSFISTAAARGAEGRSALGGRSHCDQCRQPLGYRQMVPVASFVALGGRCSVCAAEIPRMHVYGEIAGAFAAFATVLLTSPPYWLPGLSLAALLIFVSVFDVRTFRIPDLASGMVAAFGLLAARVRGDALEALATALVALATLWAAQALFKQIRNKPGLGLGDVKLISALSLWTGPLLTPVAVTLSCGFALAWLAAQGQLRSPHRLPFGPFISLGFWFVALGRASA
jgi:leader peptidase (prepilin peptidase)/N-methyltransferase